MNKFLIKQFLALTLLVISPLAPPGRAQSSIQDGAQDGDGRRQRFEAALFIRTELYFGMNRSDGGEVSRKEFDGFLAGVVTPRFPEGLTVIQGRGQFLNFKGDIERERSAILILLYPLNARAEKHGKVEEIREEYIARFKQQSVLRLDYPLPVWVSF